MVEQSISKRQFTKTLLAEEIAPYVVWGEPFLVRDTGRNGLYRYEISGPLRATAFMSQYRLDDRLRAEQFDQLTGLLAVNHIQFERNEANIQVLMNYTV